MNIGRDEAERRIAVNIADMLNNSERIMLVNLGIGIPTQVSDYIINENIYLHAENGMIGVGPRAEGEDVDYECINAGRQPVKETVGCVYVDSCESFGMIRGGHVDVTVLGAFQVNGRADVANWIIPGGKQLGVGGAMDLITGAKQVIIAMTHMNKGQPKLVKECTLPVTGFGEADIVVTEMGIFRFVKNRFVLEKIARDTTLEEITRLTEFDFEISRVLEYMAD